MRKTLFHKLSLVGTLILLFWLNIRSQAAGEISTLEIRDLSLVGCRGDTFEGSFKVVALDADGAVVNLIQPVETRRFYTTSYAFVWQEGTSTSGQSENFFIDFNGAPITYGTLTIVLKSNPATQSLTYHFNCFTGEITPQKGLDTRINYQIGDLISVLYPSVDSEGNPTIQVYDVESDGRGTYVGTYSYDLFTPYLNVRPETSVELDRIGKTSLYALTTGEFQINIGPDIEGKVVSVIFRGLPPVEVYKHEYNVYSLAEQR
jgi:hypothetical protein